MSGGLLPSRHKTILLLFTLVCASCASPKKERAVTLYKTYCASCHIAPSIGDLPKAIWEKAILPDMGARMGIRDMGYNPMEGKSFREQEAILQTGIYPGKPIISAADWELLKKYIISLAPDSLIHTTSVNSSNELSQFIPKPISLDSTEGSFITFLKHDKHKKRILIGNMSGELFQYDAVKGEKIFLGQFGKSISDYSDRENRSYATAIGHLNPSDISSGKIFVREGDSVHPIPEILHRPVHTLVHDLNKNGVDELVVSEFGNLTGKLSLLMNKGGLQYEKRILLDRPGTIRVVAKDMNRDGRDDLVVLTSQGDEGITILYQEEDLRFRAENVIRFSPVYGSSWFQLIDYDGDGDDDIITVNGDNADKSYVHKPYHGMRIHINDGTNNFEEKYFYSLNGATRSVARDFDQDGDIDIGLLSTFPDYDNKPGFSFVYLENRNAQEFAFSPYTFKGSTWGRWLLMDAGDVDNDGDEDIILSSFTYAFTPVPKDLSKLWKEKNVDMMLLENKLKTNP